MENKKLRAYWEVLKNENFILNFTSGETMLKTLSIESNFISK